MINREDSMAKTATETVRAREFHYAWCNRTEVDYVCMVCGTIAVDMTCQHCQRVKEVKAARLREFLESRRNGLEG